MRLLRRGLTSFTEFSLRSFILACWVKFSTDNTLKYFPIFPENRLKMLTDLKGRMQPLRKHAHLNILIISPPKNENFQIKNSDIFHVSAQNIDCWYSLQPPRRGGSNEYPQSMF